MLLRDKPNYNYEKSNKARSQLQSLELEIHEKSKGRKEELMNLLTVSSEIKQHRYRFNRPKSQGFRSSDSKWEEIRERERIET